MTSASANTSKALLSSSRACSLQRMVQGSGTLEIHGQYRVCLAHLCLHSRLSSLCRALLTRWQSPRMSSWRCTTTFCAWQTPA